MSDDELQEVIEAYERRGLATLLPDDGFELRTWQFEDGSRQSGSVGDFEEERDLAITMRRARGNPLAQRYTARFGMTYKELPISRAASRELRHAASCCRCHQPELGADGHFDPR
jgi:hypothetical protein